MVEILTLPYGLFQACSHLICLPGGTCLIDPAVSPVYLPANRPQIRWLVVTHGHMDHISQADNLRRATSAPLWIHAADQDCLYDPNRNLSSIMPKPLICQPAEFLLSDGQILPLAEGCDLEVIHTPGHSAGGICLLLLEEGRPTALFSGDTLFAGSIGRLDFGGDPAAMRTSLERLCRLTARLAGTDIAVYPGHGPQTTLLREISENPYLQDFQNLEDLEDLQDLQS